jgi:lactate dehydrogenase-like 2-hydroxyacid dehydrogenase
VAVIRHCSASGNTGSTSYADAFELAAPQSRPAVTANRPDILVLSPWYQPAMDELEQQFTAHKLWQADDKDALLASLRDTCVGITGSTVCGAALMDALPNVRVIANNGVGYDGIDVAAATQRGIRVSNTPDVLSDEVADFALALMLATLRRVPQGDRYVRAGRWEREGPMPLTQRVWGRKLGMLGLGRIGIEIARRCEAFKMDIRYHTRTARDVPYRYYSSLVDMARDVDILVAIVPGGAETRHLVDRDVLDALGPHGVFINVARGSVADENALIAALSDGRLGAAGLDVFADEPQVPQALKDMADNVVLQPHQASATHETRLAMGRLAIENLLAGVAGKPLITPVN